MIYFSPSLPASGSHVYLMFGKTAGMLAVSGYCLEVCMQNVVRWRKQSSEPIVVDDMTLTPQSQVLAVKLPFVGFVWHRPTAVTVRSPRQNETLPITDPTRVILWSILGMSILVNLLILVKKVALVRRSGGIK